MRQQRSRGARRRTGSSTPPTPSPSDLASSPRLRYLAYQWLCYIAFMANVNSLRHRGDARSRRTTPEPQTDAVRSPEGDRMPTPARTSLDQIVKAGRDIVEADGIDGLTMQSIAAAVGVRPPSLYKRIRNRNDLLRLVANDAAAELTRDLETAVAGKDPRDDLATLARTFRRFARDNPGAYSLIFAPLPDEARADPEWSVKASAPVISAT